MDAFKESDIKRFWASVDVRGPGDCWEWRGKVIPAGYGHFAANSKEYRAHRLALGLCELPANDNFLACHHCDNKRCCNPSHLYWGTKSQNSIDCYARNANMRSRRVFSVEQARCVKELLATGLGCAEIARRLGAPIHAVNAIRRGISFSYLV